VGRGNESGGTDTQGPFRSSLLGRILAGRQAGGIGFERRHSQALGRGDGSGGAGHSVSVTSVITSVMSFTSVAFSPDGKLVVSGASDRRVMLWDAATGAAMQTLKHSNSVTPVAYSVTPVAFSPDGKLVVSGAGDRTVQLWDAATGAAIQTLEGYSDSVYSVAPFPAEYVAGEWITKEKENLLWLPPDYRATCVAVRNGVLAIGHASGAVSLFELC
jgi:WD40 repeat protein